jgi:putative cell wall-binding protein
MRIVGFMRRPGSKLGRSFLVGGAASVLALSAAIVGASAPAFASFPPGVYPTVNTAGSTTSYIVAFQITNDLDGSDTITLVAPTGTVFPSAVADYDVEQSNNPAVGATLTGGGNTVSIVAPASPSVVVGGGGDLVVYISHVINPASAPNLFITASTTNNVGQPVGPYSIVGATAVTGVSVVPTPATGGAAAAYVVLFTTTTGLTSGVDTITLTGPPGTIFPTLAGDYTVGSALTSVGATPTQTAPNNVTIVVPATYAAGAMQVHAANVTNPGTASNTETLTVSTSLDSAAGTSTTYTITAPTAVGTVTIEPSTTTAGAIASYTISFIPDAALTGGTTTVTFTGPSGTVFPTAMGSYTVSDNGGVAAALTVATSQSTFADVTFTLPNSILAGHTVTIVVTGVTNPGAGATTLAVRTSVDTGAALGSYTITASGGIVVPPVVTPVTTPIATPPIRTAGADRFGTAIATSLLEFPAADSASSVVLSRSDDFADALVGTTLASTKDGPLLFADGADLTPATVTEIQRVLPAGATVYLLGGTDAIPAPVVTTLTSLGYTPVRIAGADRFATSVANADALGDPTTVLLATGENFPDALTAGAAAAHLGGVVLLTDGTSLPAEVQAYLTAHPGKVYAIGGPAVAADPSATAIAGADRYATATALAAALFTAPTTLGVASGVTFPDALSGGAFEAHADAPLLLSAPSALSPSTSSYLTANVASVVTTNIFGGDTALSPTVQTGIGTALGL